MGLDIIAVNHLVYVGQEYKEGLLQVPTITDSQGKEWAELLKARCRYAPGFYQHGLREAFRAGSYSGYNQWRDMLDNFVAYIVKKALVTGGGQRPFAELLDFSDCEGVIDDATSKKLFKDFTKYAPYISDFTGSRSKDRGEYFLSKYKEWAQAFEIAEDYGAVFFH